jgi:hypothetical protein
VRLGLRHGSNSLLDRWIDRADGPGYSTHACHPPGPNQGKAGARVGAGGDIVRARFLVVTRQAAQRNMEKFSLFAQVALLLSIPVSISLFFLLRPQRAALITILGGDMFLPELVNFKLPLLPPLEKHNLPYLCVLIGCLLRRPSLVTTVCRERWFVFLAFALVAGAMMTGLTNGVPTIARLHHPPVAGIHLIDGLYSAAVYLTLVFVPFYLGCSGPSAICGRCSRGW